MKQIRFESGRGPLLVSIKDGVTYELHPGGRIRCLKDGRELTDEEITKLLGGWKMQFYESQEAIEKHEPCGEPFLVDGIIAIYDRKNNLWTVR